MIGDFTGQCTFNKIFNVVFVKKNNDWRLLAMENFHNITCTTAVARQALAAYVMPFNVPRMITV